MFVTNNPYSRTVLLLAGFALMLITQQAGVVRAAEREGEKSSAKVGTAPTKYMRIVHDSKDRVVGLETAIVAFRPAEKGAVPFLPANGARSSTPRALQKSGQSPQASVQVELVAAVHVADKQYYQELNKRFAGYDVVLYELVAPEGTRIPKGGRKEKGGSVLSSVQVGMKNVLELAYQLDEIDYTCKNFVHADLSPDEFLKSMHDRNEGFTEIVARLVALGIAKEASGGGGSGMKLLPAPLDSNPAMALKRAVAEQFEDSEEAMAILDGPSGSTLIGERNKRALEVLKRQLAAGKKKIAIFYGGGHMADMEKHLRADFGLNAEKTDWLRAWDMK
jgi:hypothetical protein